MKTKAWNKRQITTSTENVTLSFSYPLSLFFVVVEKSGLKQHIYMYFQNTCNCKLDVSQQRRQKRKKKKERKGNISTQENSRCNLESIVGTFVLLINI